MRTFHLEGTIGIDVIASDLREFLTSAQGGPVTVEVNSPGGNIVEGLGIIAAVKGYRGPISAHIVGVAASMASAILCAFRRVTAEPSGSVMIHLPSGAYFGDHRSISKGLEILKGFTKTLVGLYALRIRKPEPAIEKLLEDETWYFGREEMLSSGLVDEVIGAASSSASFDRAVAIARGRSAVSAAASRLAASGRADSLEAVAACLGAMTTAPTAAAPTPLRVVTPSMAKFLRDSGLSEAEIAKMDSDALAEEMKAAFIDPATRAELKRIWNWTDADLAAADATGMDRLRARLRPLNG